MNTTFLHIIIHKGVGAELQTPAVREDRLPSRLRQLVNYHHSLHRNKAWLCGCGVAVLARAKLCSVNVGGQDRSGKVTA